MTIQAFQGQDYELNDPVRLQALLGAMGGVIANQAQTITNIQAGAPVQLTQGQLTNMVGGILAGQAQPHAIQAIDPVLTRRNNQDTPYEEHQVPAGMKDVKSIKDARPFTGERSDAKPFLTRLKAYFQARPNAMKFTKNRILYTVDLMGARKCRIWSSMVRKAIAEQLDNEYYFNNWDEFQAAFIKMFGLTNETQPYLARLFAYKMGKDKDLKDFVAYFEHLRSESKLPKDQAFFHLKRATREDLRSALFMRKPPPANYDEWMESLEEIQTQNNDLQEFEGFNALGTKSRGSSYHPSYKKQGHRQPSVDPDAMQVDAINMKKGKRPMKKSSKPSRKDSSKSSRLPPHPTSKKPVDKPRASGSKTDFKCFACDKPGHYSRNCTTRKKEIPIEYIRQMGMLLETIEDSKNQNESDSEEDEHIYNPDSGSEEEEEEDLIKLESEESDEQSGDDLDF